MSEPRPERRVLPRTEVGKLLADDLWARSELAPKLDPAITEEKRDALLAAYTPEGKRVQLIATVTKDRANREVPFTVQIEPTNETLSLHSDDPSAVAKFDGKGDTVKSALQDALQKMRAAAYSPEVSGLDL